MCGIAGFFGNLNSSPNTETLKKTLKLMSIRGPDYKNFYIKNIKSKNLSFLHSRLSIIDPSQR